MNKQSNLILRINKTTKKDFNDLADRNGLSMSAILNALILDMINKDKLPSTIDKYLHGYVDYKYKVLTIDEIKHFLLMAIKSSELEDKITKVYLFGSYARGEATETSDIDIRIETTNDFSLFDLSRFHQDIVAFSCKSVDVATQDPEDMDPDFYNEIRKEEFCIYERT